MGERDWKDTACFLWKLLDDIDTLDDACRENDRAFRDAVREKQKRRHGTIPEGIYDEWHRRTFNKGDADHD